MTTEFDAYERSLWAGRAAAYEQVFMQQSRHLTDPLLDAVGAGSGTRLLDAGTGPGPVAAAAAARGAQVTAVDADPGMAEAAARNVPEAQVLIGVLPDLGLSDATFDAVVGNFVINHVGDPAISIAALARLLRPGGRLALTCWHHPHTVSNSLIQTAWDEVGLPWPEDLPVSPFRELGEPAPFAALLRQAGLKAVEVAEVSWEHRVDPEVWWSGPASGVGASGVALGRLDPITLGDVKAAYDRLVAQYATPDGLVALPACALLASGTSPGSVRLAGPDRPV